MSKPKRKLLGTSEKLLKGVISLSRVSHSLGMNGVLMMRKLGGGVALLSVVSSGATEGTQVFAPAAWVLLTAGWAVPCVTIMLSRLTGSCTRRFLSGKVARDIV